MESIFEMRGASRCEEHHDEKASFDMVKKGCHIG